MSVRGLLVAVCLFGIGYLLGGATVYKQFFPFQQMQQLKNALFPDPLKEPKPRNTVFQTFSPKADVVMIGDSLTQGAEWSEIFPEIRIANRGIGSDTTAGILQRMGPIHAVNPEKAFVMAGINDLYAGKTTEEILANCAAIVAQLQDNGVEVYIQSTIECSRDKCGPTLDGIRQLNAGLKAYAEQHGISFIDLNEGMTTEQDGLLHQYTHDGIHLLGPGYAVWAERIEPYVTTKSQ